MGACTDCAGCGTWRSSSGQQAASVHPRQAMPSCAPAQTAHAGAAGAQPAQPARPPPPRPQQRRGCAAGRGARRACGGRSRQSSPAPCRESVEGEAAWGRRQPAAALGSGRLETVSAALGARRERQPPPFRRGARLAPDRLCASPRFPASSTAAATAASASSRLQLFFKPGGVSRQQAAGGETALDIRAAGGAHHSGPPHAEEPTDEARAAHSLAGPGPAAPPARGSPRPSPGS